MPSYKFSEDNGYDLKRVGSLTVMQKDAANVLGTVCETSENLWNEHPDSRPAVLQHLFGAHGLGYHTQSGEIATVLEFDNLIRQLKRKEKPAGVIYQRQEYQPD